MNCPYCGDLLSYPKSQGGETSDCPYCDHEITLPPHVPQDRKKLMLLVATWIGTIAAAVLVAYIAWQLFQYYEVAPDLGGVVVGVLGAVTVVLWIVFPVFVYHYLGRIARATESSESLLQIISKKMDSR